MVNHFNIHIYATMQQYATNHHRFVHNCKIIVLSISFKNIRLLLRYADNIIHN